MITSQCSASHVSCKRGSTHFCCCMPCCGSMLLRCQSISPTRQAHCCDKCDKQMNRHPTVTQTLLCIAYYADSANRTETLEKLLRLLYNECTSVTKQCLKYKMQKKWNHTASLQFNVVATACVSKRYCTGIVRLTCDSTIHSGSVSSV